ncbi:response regulator transcription factor [Pseudoalteromonas aurantia]|uniref:DNA-binding response regulator n=2 Tax=Pseudoalteromonas TaxID=53246 RepID=A0A5S3V7E9_9GAMM|nr:response regulator transcription factor [Pseudoalteromonas aurantia]TMO62572.1 DNA-binding response regulator [Pseudoalteromonas aurantia]TMO66887.1 DNA-binding response regulator [Pseudoalteromonas aurantia]TMO76274.1 DNA-binding response regulator [Pseudoalteromonas aurantia]
MAKILIAESEVECFTQRKIMFEEAGHEVFQFSDMDEMSQWATSEDVCGVVLSEHFTLGDPTHLIEKVKAKFLAPIMVCTDLKDEDTHSALLESGADDVITTSATPRLWQARLNALLRQYSSDKSAVLTFGSLVVDSQARLVTLNNREVYLTSHEFELLWLLARNAGNVLSREYVYQTIIEKPYQDDTRTVDVRISRLRKKLEDDPSQPSKIKTIWKQGYIFVREAWK